MHSERGRRRKSSFGATGCYIPSFNVSSLTSPWRFSRRNALTMVLQRHSRSIRTGWMIKCVLPYRPTVPAHVPKCHVKSTVPNVRAMASTNAVSAHASKVSTDVNVNVILLHPQSSRKFNNASSEKPTFFVRWFELKCFLDRDHRRFALAEDNAFAVDANVKQPLK